MNVSGCSTLEESFEKYCEEETLEGDNIYHAGDTLGKQVTALKYNSLEIKKPNSNYEIYIDRSQQNTLNSYHFLRYYTYISNGSHPKWIQSVILK